MKTDNNLKIKILFGALAVMLIVFFTLTRQGQKHYQWNESYQASSDQPYGTLFIQKLLAKYRPDQKFIINSEKTLVEVLDTSKIKVKTDYVFIGQETYMDDPDLDALAAFVASGNNAFIASVNLPFDLLERVFTIECHSKPFLVENDSLTVTLNFYNDKLRTENGYRFSYRYGRKDAKYFWKSLNPEVFCDSVKSTIPLGTIHPDMVNFFKVPYGKGYLYIHTNPLVFTNYFMTKESGVEYASGVFSHMDGQAIIWDEFSKSEFLAKNNAPEISPIAYILQQDSLRYAWWLILGVAALYALFTAKRKQRIIPVLEPKANTSLEFVNMVSTLHFRNGDHHDIARKKLKYFFHFIKSKYSIHTHALTAPVVKRLSEKSKVKLSDLESIANEINYVEKQSRYDEQRLIGLHAALDNFYKNCK